MDRKDRFDPTSVIIDAKNSSYCKSFTKDGTRIPTRVITEGFKYYLERDKENMCVKCLKTLITSSPMIQGTGMMLAEDLKNCSYIFSEMWYADNAVDALVLQWAQHKF
jgi:hypothetical protein